MNSRATEAKEPIDRAAVSLEENDTVLARRPTDAIGRLTVAGGVASPERSSVPSVLHANLHQSSTFVLCFWWGGGGVRWEAGEEEEEISTLGARSAPVGQLIAPQTAAACM